jgi:glycosyltransferase involved in cell wall biosynthesis
MGGPAHHVGLLDSMLNPECYETLLLHGQVGDGEASLEDSVRTRGVTLAKVPGLRPELRPHDDARALASLVRAVRRVRPDIVHTHTAKAGTLGRLAAVLAGRARPMVVHTYHGHVLEGYFDPLRTATYRTTERRLATVSDALVGVSQATIDDLVRLGIAPRSKFRVIPIGLDLDPFLRLQERDGARFRREVGARDGEVLLTFVGRLVPIKRVDLLLRALARVRAGGAPVRLAVVGGGPLQSHLERLSRELGVAAVTRFVGYRPDMASVAAASDLAVLSSANEGTPVWLIEAAAAGRPAVGTAVGGVPDVVREGTGILVEEGHADSLARGVARLAADPELRRSMGMRARHHVAERFSAERLVRDVDGLYRELLKSRGGERKTVASRAMT